MAADIDLPPAKYDHPYSGRVQFVYDFPLALDDGDYLWGYTVLPPRVYKSADGKAVSVYLAPLFC